LRALYTGAVGLLRAGSTPFHLANGLLDHVAYLQRAGNADGVAEPLIAEAADIAVRLGCLPLKRRADELGAATSEASVSAVAPTATALA
jgi:hypothetical protein